jgi:serine/threonine protein kinase
MSALSINDISNSLSVPSLILDQELKNAVFELTNLGLPVMFVGGFSVVFPAHVGSKKYAFRCWHASLENLKDRYKYIDDYFANLNLPYFCNFKYIEKGIIINGIPYPTTRMEWVNGLPLKKYLKSHINNSSELLEVSRKFKKMCSELHKNQISHGDLQHGNILITPQGEIRLVDYDSIFVPSFSKENDEIKGLAGYQHPCRVKNIFLSPKSDYFSELIIYLSLLSLAKNPDLFLQYDLENTEHLLFNNEDFRGLEQSNIYSDLRGLDDEIDSLLEVLKVYLQVNSIDNLEDFDTTLSKIITEPTILQFTSDLEVIIESMSAKLKWNVESYQTLKVIDEKGTTIDVTGKSEIEVFPIGIGQFILCAKNYTKTVFAEHRFQVFPTPIIERLLIPEPIFYLNTDINITFPNFTLFEHFNTIPKTENFNIKFNSAVPAKEVEIVELKYRLAKDTITGKISKIFRSIKQEIFNEHGNKQKKKTKFA